MNNKNTTSYNTLIFLTQAIVFDYIFRRCNTQYLFFSQ